MAFQPGRSGNPKGRRPGIKDRRSALRDLIAKQAPELIQLAVNAARAGDTGALGLLLARCIPPLRPTGDPVHFELPAGASPSDQARAVLAAIAAGELDPHNGRALLDAVATVVRIVEADEFERRIASLEKRAAGNGE